MTRRSTRSLLVLVLVGSGCASAPPPVRSVAPAADVYDATGGAARELRVSRVPGWRDADHLRAIERFFGAAAADGVSFLPPDVALSGFGAEVVARFLGDRRLMRVEGPAPAVKLRARYLRVPVEAVPTIDGPQVVDAPRPSGLVVAVVPRAALPTLDPVASPPGGVLEAVVEDGRAAVTRDAWVAAQVVIASRTDVRIEAGEPHGVRLDVSAALRPDGAISGDLSFELSHPDPEVVGATSAAATYEVSLSRLARAATRFVLREGEALFLVLGRADDPDHRLVVTVTWDLLRA